MPLNPTSYKDVLIAENVKESELPDEVKAMIKKLNQTIKAPISKDKEGNWQEGAITNIKVYNDAISRAIYQYSEGKPPVVDLEKEAADKASADKAAADKAAADKAAADKAAADKAAADSKQQGGSFFGRMFGREEQ